MTATDAAAGPSRIEGRDSSIVEEILLQCTDGIKLAGQRWSNQNQLKPPKRRILCLHGWLDNCRSFFLLAPKLVTSLPDTVVVALDLPGHGVSSHKSADGPSSVIADYAYYVSESVSQLEWEGTPFTLIGHSMGAAVSLVYAAAFPEHVEKLILLEGAAPYHKDASDLANHVRLHIQQRLQGNLMPTKPSLYPNVQSAVETRRETAKAFPGQQYISEPAAFELVRRASRDVDGGIQFVHDPRLKWPSLVYYTQEQSESLYTGIKCECCLLLGHDGMPWGEERTERIKGLLKPSMFEILPGSHHFHMDPDSADKVADFVVKFLAS